MNIGDKVRLMHYKQEGIITKIIDEKLLEVEIEDDFKIPVLKSEVVFVAQEEEKRFGKSGQAASPTSESTAQPTSTKVAKAERGIFLGIVAESKEVFSIFLINNTDRPIPYCLNEEMKGLYNGVKSGCLSAKTNDKVKTFSFSSLNDRSTLIFQWLHHTSRSVSLPAPTERRLLMRPQHLQRKQGTLPQIGKKGILLQLDGNDKSEVQQMDSTVINGAALQDQMNSGAAISSGHSAAKPSAEVDLHIEKICQHFMDLSSTEILLKQLDHFDDALERALAADMPEIIFIHGVGNGKLRDELHKRLAKNNEIKNFKDAGKEKFGYGATQVRLK